jgi:hypothetical protein
MTVQGMVVGGKRRQPGREGGPGGVEDSLVECLHCGSPETNSLEVYYFQGKLDDTRELR